ncbi:MAG: type II toxin-antitoxin system HicB family antitoxin [Xenococcaceae cyanobacterium]
MQRNIQLKLEIFQEDELYVGICPALNVSSFGDTVIEAKQSIQEALEAFLEECQEMGTLSEVLEESGFSLQNGMWIYPQPVAANLQTKY